MNIYTGDIYFIQFYLFYIKLTYFHFNFKIKLVIQLIYQSSDIVLVSVDFENTKVICFNKTY